MTYLIKSISVATGREMWVTGLNYDVKSEECTGPIVSVSSDRDQAKVFSRAEADEVLPDVKACYPDSQIVRASFEHEATGH